MNAVGLTNPGAEAFIRQLESLEMPEDRFLLISIFGGDVDEFVKVAELLSPYADGLELNLSCPNAAGYGMAMGQDAETVRRITAAVKHAVSVPVIPKLTPNVPNIADIARAAVEGGADAICSMNTVGPGYYTVDGQPVLTNTYGGMSGKGIFPIGLKCVSEIAAAVDVPIIGCGGISNAEGVRAYQQAGASIFAIGSAGVTGMNTPELKAYFQQLQQDFETGTNEAASLTKTVNLGFRKMRLIENQRLTDDFSVLVFDQNISIQPGQFVFVWIPGVGEKPFSVLDDAPFTLAIQQRGCFTQHLCTLQAGSEVYVRGPYGVPIDIPEHTKPVLVCGGCGLAAVYPIAKNIGNCDLFIGVKSAEYLFYLEKAREIATVYIATDNGSQGYHGVVTDLLKQRLQEQSHEMPVVFYNCGPEAMIEAAVTLEQRYTPGQNIYNSIDYITKCGVGVCGSCATPDGHRACVDGPFLQ
jgi:dihydroorotate dehydrogenase (NAD+) catalytic subunit